jgi:hypothetical protein
VGIESAAGKSKDAQNSTRLRASSLARSLTQTREFIKKKKRKKKWLVVVRWGVVLLCFICKEQKREWFFQRGDHQGKKGNILQQVVVVVAVVNQDINLGRESVFVIKKTKAQPSDASMMTVAAASSSSA